MWHRRHVYRVLVGRTDGKRRLGTPRCRMEDCIKMELQAEGWRGMSWIDLAQDRNKVWALVNAVMNLWVPQNAGNASQEGLCSI
jgi:hypothetical protein